MTQQAHNDQYADDRSLAPAYAGALGGEEAESPQVVAGRIAAARRVVPSERLVVAPDCRMRYLARAPAHAKLRAMVAGARPSEEAL